MVPAPTPPSGVCVSGAVSGMPPLATSAYHCAAALFGCAAMLSGFTTHAVLLASGGCLLMMVSASLLLVLVLGRHGPSDHLFACGLLLQAVAFAAMDLSQAAVGGARLWPLLLVVLQVGLPLAKAGPVMRGITAGAVLWLVLLLGEDVFRFGLYDVPGTPSQQERRERVACTCLPCARPYPELPSSLLATLIFFVVSHGISAASQCELSHRGAAVEACVAAVPQACAMLEQYDLDNVDEFVAEARNIPPPVCDSLLSVAHTLRSHRPYLPGSLFAGLAEEHINCTPHRASVLPPGARNGVGTVVFTDIRASTALWEAAPEAMSKAMRVHNMEIRHEIERWDGYEVKTVGDSFMVAFDSSAPAINFGLCVHESLAHASWPAALLAIPICSREGPWGGLTVRIGMNSGPLTVEENPITHRVDYFGHTVNVASRLESLCDPGALALRSDVWDAADKVCIPAVFTDPVAVRLKGMADLISVMYLWPRSLEERMTFPLLKKGTPWSTRLPADIVSPRPSQSISSSRATIGTMRMPTDQLRGFATQMHTMCTLLERSAGSLVTVLGDLATFAWNTSRLSEAHVDNSFRFVQLMVRMKYPHCIGLCTGVVSHGTVGSLQQRFQTVLGPSVRASWRLCEAVDPGEGGCLYACLDNEISIPASLKQALLPCDGPQGCGRVYSVLVEEISGSRDTEVMPFFREASDSL